MTILTPLLIAALAFFSGGYIYERSAPWAMAYLVLCAIWIWFVRRRSAPLSRLYLLGLVVFALFCLWQGASVVWSFGPDLSWLAFNVASCYLVVLAGVGLVPLRASGLRVLTGAFLVVMLAVSAYALLGKVVPEIVTHAHEYARLSSPVGYWNGLGIMIVMALPLCLAWAADHELPWWLRTVSAAAAVPMAAAFFFTFSRGSWLALALALVVYFAFTSSRLASLASLAVITLPLAYAIYRVRGLDTLFNATTDAPLRNAQGRALLVSLVVAVAATAIAQVALALASRRFSWPPGVRRAVGIAAIVVVVAAGVGVPAMTINARGGLPWLQGRLTAFLGDSDTTGSENSAGRLFSVNTGRLPSWKAALEQSRVRPITGTGAGTFTFTNYRFRPQAFVVRHAHSQWLNTLSELGLVGLTLLAVSLLLVIAAAARNTFVRRADHLRPVLVSLQAGIVAFLAHMTWDWGWDMMAAGVSFGLFIAAAAAYGHTRGGVAPPPAATTAGRRILLRLTGSLLLLVLAASWLVPYLSERALIAALASEARGNTKTALTEARRASDYNPLAVDPLVTEARLLQKQGRNGEARERLRRAVALQPENYRAHREYGLLLLRVYLDHAAAAEELRVALSLNPLDTALKADYQRALAPATR